ncbi:MAG: beta-mannosidase [Dictyoglomaceae bacterium]
MERIDLQGEWSFKEKGEDKWHKGKVPGCIHLDLMENEIIPDPFIGENEIKVQWVEERDWIYQRKFNIDKEFLNYPSIELSFQGLDTFTEIYLNSQKIGETDNMFIPWSFEVKPYLKEGENILEVYFHSPSKILEEKAKKHPSLQGSYYPQRVFGRKAQYSFGWDWGPRLATSGIWKPVSLIGWKQARIRDIWIPVGIRGDKAQVNLELEIELMENSNIDIPLRISLDKPILEKRLRLTLPEGKVFIKIPLVIENPKLWYPNGFGDQPIYTLQLVLVDGNGEILDRKEQKFAIRKVDLVTQRDDMESSFIFYINDIPIFAKGANWIPSDSFLPRLKGEDYRELLLKAKSCGVNMLRVWGGGIYENDIFYDLCDELGILVWQDFMFACGEYPEDEEFLKKVQEEAEIIVKKLRNHPSIVIWCGNNENDWGYYAKWWGERERFWGETIYHKILPDVCARLDMTRPYWPSSPFGGKDPNSEKEGDRHSWIVWSGWMDYKGYLKDNGKFISEFGFQAPPHKDTIKKFITSPKEYYPQSREMEFHNKQINGTERIIRFLAEHFKIPSNMDEYIYLSQINQGLALKTGIEHWRNNKFNTGGALIWQWNDCWPVVSWSIIDYYKKEKPSYFFVKRAFKDIKVNIEERERELVIFGVNDTLEDFEGEINIELLTFRGRREKSYNLDIKIPRNSSVKLYTLSKIKPNIYDEFIKVNLFTKDGKLIDRNDHFFAPFKHLNLPQAKVVCKIEKENEDYKITLTSNNLALFIALKLDNAEWEDNYFNLYPKESYTVKFKSSHDLDFIKQKLKIEGYNLKEVEIIE